MGVVRQTEQPQFKQSQESMKSYCCTVPSFLLFFIYSSPDARGIVLTRKPPCQFLFLNTTIQLLCLSPYVSLPYCSILPLRASAKMRGSSQSHNLVTLQASYPFFFFSTRRPARTKRAPTKTHCSLLKRTWVWLSVKLTFATLPVICPQSPGRGSGIQRGERVLIPTATVTRFCSFKKCELPVKTCNVRNLLTSRSCK